MLNFYHFRDLWQYASKLCNAAVATLHELYHKVKLKEKEFIVLEDVSSPVSTAKKRTLEISPKTSKKKKEEEEEHQIEIEIQKKKLAEEQEAIKRAKEQLEREMQRIENEKLAIERMKHQLEAEKQLAKEQVQALAKENDLLKEQTLCNVCMDSKIEILFLPCNHQCCCSKCADTLYHCPLCRVAINVRYKIFR